MRTTVDLPDDLHAIASAIAHDRHQSLSRTIADLVRQALEVERPAKIEINPQTGFPIVRVGRPITTEDVRRLEDEW
jgi:hypothetical protein